MEWLSRAWCWFFVTLCIFEKLLAFNLEPKLAIVKKGPVGSYFGYSTEAHKITGRSGNENVMLVGAPKSNVTGYESVASPGALYRCPLTTTILSDCEVVGADRLYNKNQLQPDEEIDNQWLGVTVTSSGERILLCAHRNKYTHVSNIPDTSFRYGIGMCKVLLNSLDVSDSFHACRSAAGTGHVGYGYCQQGTSGAIDEDNVILIGGPGAYNWIGSAMKTQVVTHPLRDDGSWYKSGVELTSDTNPPPVEINSHLGMSVAIGNILNEKTYVAGAPRSGNTGKVVLLTQVKNNAEKYLKFEPEHILSVDNFGASFGHSVVAMDLNNDGKDDLVVSAPFYSEKNVGGAVFVYMNQDGITSSTVPIVIKSRTLTAKECKEINCEMARFGFAIANIGDINRDGYLDLAVGAPYEQDGVVYIYHGSEDGINTEYTQRIASSDIEGDLKAFGSSLAGSRDLDDNGYADLVVGAFESDASVFVPTRPVMNIMATITDQDTITVEPKAKKCKETDEEGQCFTFEACFKYTAEPQDRFQSRYTIIYTVEEVKETLLPRLRFEDTPNPADFKSNYKMEARLDMEPQRSNKKNCQTHIVHISKNNKDILHPVQMKLTYRLDSPEPSVLKAGQPVPDSNLFPIVNQAETMINFEVAFKKDCGPDKKCTADLVVEGSWEGLEMEGDVAILSVGTVDSLNLKIKYINEHEKAYNAMLYIKLPEELRFRKNTHRDGEVTCESTNDDNTMLACDFGNPYENNTDTVIRLPFPIPQTTRDMLNVELYAETSSEELDKANNNATVKLRVIVKADMIISGASEPEQVVYAGEVKGESAIQFEEDIGDAVTHTYVVTNGGPGTVFNSEVEISWPYEVENKRDKGKHLLYLTQAPTVEGSGRCEMDPKWINPLNVEVTRIPNRYEVITTPQPDNTSEETVEYKPTRRKREVVVTAEEVTDSEGNIQKVVKMDCIRKTAKCFKFKCYLNALSNKQDAVIRIRARLWRSTFVEDYKNVDMVEIRSHAVILLDPELNIQQPPNTNNDAADAKTVAVPDVSLRPQQEGVAIWIIIVAACAGLLLLVILIVVLWKLGFFRRRRPEDEMQQHEVKVVKDKYKYEEVSASEC